MRAYVCSRVNGESLFGTLKGANEATLESQHSMLLKEAADAGYKVVGQGSEIRAWGMSDIAKKNILSAAQNKDFDLLLFMRTDRLSRDVGDLFDFMRQLDDEGIKLQSVTEGWINEENDDGSASNFLVMKRMRETLMKDNE